MNWNSVVFWVLLVIICIIGGVYFAFGPRFQTKPQVIIGVSKQDTIDETRQIIVHEGNVNVFSEQIHYRQTFPRDYEQTDNAIVLLHGAKYSSLTWKGLGTLQLLAYNGYRAIAIDLPGYGLSKKATGPSNEREVVSWMTSLIKELKLNRIVLVAPSMSGKYGIPFLLKQNDIDLVGFVGMSPGYTNAYSKNEYGIVEIPVINIWGEKDRTDDAQQINHWLLNIPNYKSVMIEKGEHTPFVGNRAQFHRELLNWLKSNCGKLKEYQTNQRDVNIDDSDDDNDNNNDNDNDNDNNNDNDNDNNDNNDIDDDDLDDNDIDENNDMIDIDDDELDVDGNLDENFSDDQNDKTDENLDDTEDFEFEMDEQK